jgi:hypothetical protein
MKTRKRIVRPIRVEGDIAYVPLTQGYEAVIDADDVALVEGWNWCACVVGRMVYAVRTNNSDPRRRLIHLHRAVMGNPEGLVVDHIDCDGLNNRRGNLRLATTAQNQHNSRAHKDNSSGFKGVYWCNSNQKWGASIQVNRKRRYLGSFVTPEEAHAAYCAASSKMHGEFGRIA